MMKQIYSVIILMLVAQPSTPSRSVKTYPYQLDEIEVNSIIEQAVSLGIEKTKIIENFNAYSLYPDGPLFQVILTFKTTGIDTLMQEQIKLNCKPSESEQFSCTKTIYHLIKKHKSDEVWIEVKNPYQFSYDDLIEVIEYAEKIAPMNTPSEVSKIYAKENFMFEVCYGKNYACLNIKRTTESGDNYFMVEWTAPTTMRLLM